MAADFISCSIDGCNDPVDRRGWCSIHYSRWYRNGDPNTKLRASAGEPEHFFRNIVLKADPSECVIWPYAKDKFGYGIITSQQWLEPTKTRMTRASRMACVAMHGPQPDGKPHAAHTCGNGSRGCCNPHHVYWASVSDNQRDRVLHGTSNRGSRQGRSRLSEEDVRSIKARLKEGSGPTEISRIYGVHQTTITCIKTGKIWGWLVT